MREEMQRAERFADRLQEILGDTLRAVILYGSAARGEYRPGVSDLNVLVLVGHLSIDELKKLAPSMREWMSEGNAPPLMLTEQEWQNSADVFAIEYSDIRDAHILLAGTDPFPNIRIRREHLRLQLESELRSKKIQLREGYLATGADPDQLGGLLIRSLSTFLTLFRGILRLDDRPVPTGARALIEQTGAVVGFAPAPLLELLEMHDKGKSFAPGLDHPLPAAYLAAVDAAVTWLDRYTGARGGTEEV